MMRPRTCSESDARPSSDTCSAFVRSISVATPTSLLRAETAHWALGELARLELTVGPGMTLAERGARSASSPAASRCVAASMCRVRLCAARVGEDVFVLLGAV
jgi:hypothetical protein